MSFHLASQRDPLWAAKELGWGPLNGNTIGQIGCIETCAAMTVWDAFGDMHYTPDTLNDVFTSRRVYVRDPNLVDYDLLPDNAIDLVWPSRFQTEVITGYDDARVRAAVLSLDTYVWAWVTPPGISHFVIIVSPDGDAIADPWTGTYGRLSGYGGRGAVQKLIFPRKLSQIAPSPPVPVPGPPIFPIPSPPNIWDIIEDRGHQAHEGSH